MSCLVIRADDRLGRLVSLAPPVPAATAHAEARIAIVPHVRTDCRIVRDIREFVEDSATDNFNIMDEKGWF
jgi:hypothetical protein